MTDQLLAALSFYGVPALFLILAITAVGAPFPISVILVAAGSFVAQGEMKLWQVLTFGTAGAVFGDQLGYALGRWGGRELGDRVAQRVGGVEMLRRAEAFTERWGGAAIFFTRWLVTPLGPWLNLTSGITAYSWPWFLFWDVVGEALWVVLYVMLGKFFSDRVQALGDLLGNLTWAVVGIVVAVILGWKVFQFFRQTSETSTAD